MGITLSTLTGLVATLMAAAGDALESAPATAKVKASKTGRLAINGVDYYYEIYGKGEPLLLLHGGLMSLDMFGPVLPVLTKNRQVIAVDLEGHARTALGDRPYKLETQGDDMAELVKQLGHEKLDVIGYSLGGGVALRMAIQQPQRVRRVVLVSVPYADDAAYPEIKAQQAYVNAAAAPMMMDTPMQDVRGARTKAAGVSEAARTRRSQSRRAHRADRTRPATPRSGSCLH
jgi:pimeloyl-ACP methyl ester carboxylesterase